MNTELRYRFWLKVLFVLEKQKTGVCANSCMGREMTWYSLLSSQIELGLVLKARLSLSCETNQERLGLGSHGIF